MFEKEHDLSLIRAIDKYVGPIAANLLLLFKRCSESPTQTPLQKSNSKILVIKYFGLGSIFYQSLDTERTRYLRKQYRASYVMISAKGHIGNIDGLVEVFNNEGYRVLVIP